MSQVETRATALVREILVRHDIHREVGPGDSLTDAGVSSLDMVNLMLAIEAEFDIFIPPASVTPSNFRSIEAISRLVDAVQRGGAAA